MASSMVSWTKARSDLDYVTLKDLSNVLSGPVPKYVKTLFEALLKCTRPDAAVESWQQISELLQGDTDFIGKLQAYEPEDCDKHRIRDLLHSELEVTSLPTEFMATFSPACVLLLRWCHALGDACGCPEPSVPLTEEHLHAAQLEAQEARNQRAAQKSAAKATATRPAAACDDAGEGWEEGRLRLTSVMSGEVFTTLEAAQASWTYKDIVERFRPLLPGDAGVITLFVDSEPIDPYSATLRSLGVEQDGELLYKVEPAESFLSQACERLALGSQTLSELQTHVDSSVQQASAACYSLRKEDVVELRSFHKPPRVCRLVLEAVALLLGDPFDTWASLRAMMDEKGLLQRLLHVEAMSLPPTVLLQVHWYIDNPELVADHVAMISRGAKALRLWVQAVYEVALFAAHCRTLKQGA